ncbi:hypothetical protein CTAYLR_006750 [Chrysophaeum taylorii]|uniref:Uncharacterized protein n=1 Tax=Chrysophaeum taylorii TaxID=2483200 RepID=A0AAD7XHJ8_9STRA|nr:hypothetical protein CTAYLR_006750 [Chrysophaeum taylorii]
MLVLGVATAFAPAKPVAVPHLCAAHDDDLSKIASAVATRGANELELLSALDQARGLPFFSQFSIDMLANCAYIDEQPDECEFDTCEILPLDPPPAALLARDASERRFELDCWARMDPPSPDYYDLAEYPEGFTGYNGSHIWRFIYDNLAFGRYEDDPDGWRAVFDRTVSGMHASVSCHVADGMEDDDTCAREFQQRLGNFPERIANLHFAFAVVLAAVGEARGILQTYDYDVGDKAHAAEASALVNSIVSQDILAEPGLEQAADLLREAGAAANECVLVANDDSRYIEETGIWQMRQRSRAMLRAMDCVQCGVCRLHGKVCWLGLATALKLIYTHEGVSKPLARLEVAALVVALEKLASSVRFCFEMSGENPADIT